MFWKCIFLLLVTFLTKSKGIKWNQVKCSLDSEENIPEGIVENIGRFPWMGLVMHKFYLGGQMRTAMTGGVLIHPHYALAPAEDITKIDIDLLMNTTTFIMYRSKETRYILRVTDYAIHPEFFAKTTFATLAILELFTSGETGVGENKAPILPICLPFQGIGTYEDLNVVKFTDRKGDIQKTLFKMKFVPETNCEEFYNQSNLNYKQKSPPDPICAETIKRQDPCVWEGGYLLISRQNWGYWKLLGFGMRGPGCGVPSKYVDISRYMSWIDFMVSPRKPDDVWGKRLLYIRRQSPTQLTMYPADIKVPVNQGQCDDNSRGNVIFKDNSEVLMTKNFGQGFYILSIHQAAEFSCAKVYLESMSRTNAMLWLEHNCVNDVTGMRMPDKYKNQRLECFIYFKTTAYLEFRFQFSFRALIEVTLFGRVEHVKRLPNPFHATEVTFPWFPTEQYIRRRYFVAYQQYWWNP